MPSSPAKPAPNDDDLMSLDFTLPDAFSEEPAADAAVVVPVEPIVVPPPAPPPPPTTLEKFARLQAGGKLELACRMLEASVKAGEDFGTDAERAWTLLLSGYQALNQRDAFETRALEFAKRFEKSPPAWVDVATAGNAAPAAKTISASLAGTLNARVDEPLKKMLKVCTQSPVRIDLSRLTDADDSGCALLLAALQTCRKTKGTCMLAGAGHLATVLAGKAKQGVPADRNIWLLLLDLYQKLGRQEAFDDAAVAYAVSFEVSPPSWDPALIGHCEN